MRPERPDRNVITWDSWLVTLMKLLPLRAAHYLGAAAIGGAAMLPAVNTVQSGLLIDEGVEKFCWNMLWVICGVQLWIAQAAHRSDQWSGEMINYRWDEARAEEVQQERRRFTVDHAPSLLLHIIYLSFAILAAWVGYQQGVQYVDDEYGMGEPNDVLMGGYLGAAAAFGLARMFCVDLSRIPCVALVDERALRLQYRVGDHLRLHFFQRAPATTPRAVQPASAPTTNAGDYQRMDALL